MVTGGGAIAFGDHALEGWSADAPGAIITGDSTASFTVPDPNNPGQTMQVSLPVYNILSFNPTSSTDLSRDTITNIQELDLPVGGVALTNLQFASFEHITGSGTILAADGGVYSLAGGNIAPGADINLTAQSWAGTALMGNNADGEILTASLFGNDMLTAGNGAGDELIAGEGVDTLTGGLGGDTFIAEKGLATGSSLQGNGTGNRLQAQGDISGASVGGVQSLWVEGDITLTASQLAGFGSVVGPLFSTATVSAASGGVYDLTGAAGSFNMEALSDDGTSLTERGVSGVRLTASVAGADLLTVSGSNNTLDASDSSGADILTSSGGSGNTLDAGGSTGNVTLDASGDSGDSLIAGFGVDTLIGGAGNDIFNAQDGLAAGSIVTGGGGADTLQTNGDITGATITGVQTLLVEGGDSITLTAAQMAQFTTVTGSTDGTLEAATGGSYVLTGVAGGISMTALSNTGTTLRENGGGHVTLTASASGNDTLIGSGGSNNTLDARGSTGAITLDARGDSGDTLYAGSGATTLEAGTAPPTSPGAEWTGYPDRTAP